MPTTAQLLLDHHWVAAQYQCACQVNGTPAGGLNEDDTIDEADWTAHLLGLLAAAGVLVAPAPAGTSLEHGYRYLDDARVRPATSRTDATRMGTAIPVTRRVTDWTADDGRVTVRACDLSARHVGMLATLPGRLDPTTGTWADTTAPVTMVQHRRDGRVKVRRHPDSHVDHTLEPGDVLTLVPAP